MNFHRKICISLSKQDREDEITNVYKSFTKSSLLYDVPVGEMIPLCGWVFLWCSNVLIIQFKLGVYLMLLHGVHRLVITG